MPLALNEFFRILKLQVTNSRLMRVRVYSCSASVIREIHDYFFTLITVVIHYY